jgi:UDP-perosamine 4-acetyltransferase
MKKPVLILGAGGYAKVVIDIIERLDEYSIVALIGQETEKNDTFMGYKVYKGDHFLEEFRQKGYNSIFLAVGGYVDNARRTELFNHYLEAGYDMINLVHPDAIVSKSAKLGRGSIVCAGAIINPDAFIGEDAVISAGVIVEHDAQIMNHTLLSTGVYVGAGTVVEEGALLGLGAKAIPRVRIGKRTLVAAGAVVVNNIEDDAIVFGIPAKPKKQ